MRINLREAFVGECRITETAGVVTNTCINPDYTNRSKMKDRVIVGTGKATYTIRNDDQSKLIVRPPPKPLYHHHIFVHSGSGLEGPGANSRTLSPVTPRREVKVQLKVNEAYLETLGFQKGHTLEPDDIVFKICFTVGTATRLYTQTAWGANDDYRIFLDGTLRQGRCTINQKFGPDGFNASKIEVEVNMDSRVEPDETLGFTVELTSSQGGVQHADVIKVYPGTYTIKDDDLEARDPEVTLDPGSAVNEGGFARFGVRIADPPGTISPSVVVRRVKVAARVPWTDQVWTGTVITAATGYPATNSVWFDVPAYGVTGDYHLCAWVRPGSGYKVGGTSGNAPSTSTDNRRTLTDSQGNPVHNPAYGTRFDVNDGQASSCPSGHTVLIRDTGTSFQTSMSQSEAVQAPVTAVSNVQVTAVDGNTAKARWDAVPHATGYRVEFESTGDVSPGNYVYGAANGVTGTEWSYIHNAAEAMTLTVTVTPEVRTDGSVQQFDDLAGTATIEVGPGGTQGAGTQDSVVNVYAVLIAKMYEWRNDPKWKSYKSHTDRWDRALLAFGESVADASLQPMTAARAQVFADRGMSRWVEVAKALHEIEDAAEAEGTSVQSDPEITVTGGSGITEGGDAVFTVHSSPAPASDLAVTVTVADDAAGDFLSQGDEGAVTVTVLAGRTSATLPLSTENDGTDDPDGSVTVTVNDGSGYTVGSPATGAVALADDDDPVPDPVIPELRLSVGSAVDEGGNAVFTVHADRAPQTDLTVALTVAQTGDVLGDPAGSRQLTLGAGAMSAVLSLSTTDDGVDEPDGSVNVTLDAGTGYTVSAGTAASFTVSANPVPHADLTVTLDIAESGYAVAASPDDTATVSISDDDAALAGVPTLSVNDVEVQEGPYRRVEFTVMLSEATRKGASFYWRVRESDPVSARWNRDFVAASRKVWASIRPGETETRVRVALVLDDSHDEDPETFEIALRSHGGAAGAGRDFGPDGGAPHGGG